MADTLSTAIELDFADGRYRFWLGLPQANEFETKHGSILRTEDTLRASIGLDADDNPVCIGGGDGTGQQVRDILRLGLVGGGWGIVDGERVEVSPNDAKALVERYSWPERPLAEVAPIAWRVLAAAVFGVPQNTDVAEQSDA